MKRIYLYLVIIAWCSVFTLASELVLQYYSLLLILLAFVGVGTIALPFIYTDEELKEYSGYNLFCRLFHINSDLDD